MAKIIISALCCYIRNTRESGVDSSPLLHPDETPPEVLYPVLESLFQEGCGHPENGHEDDQRVAEALL